ncbi:MAG: 1-deoxy-D-xylulose-5-phosphate synthase N-terminal domain-containing protein [Patescibacteria group bacterium]
MTSVDELKQLAKLVRYNIVTSTTEAQSGHATSALSAVELLTTLFFGGYFRQNLESPHELNNDKFILSKGHSSPLLYSIYQAAGVVTREELLTLRKYGSPLEGHPTPRFKYADVATGSLGQGLSIGLGMALGLELKTKSEKLKVIPKIFVLMGDSEFAEGQIYEALQLASHYKTSNLIGILDVNRLGQRGETMLGWDIETYAKRAESFGWHVEIIEDGHNIEKILETYQNLFENTKYQIPNTKPKLIIAKTVKGKGFSIFEDQENWHGKPIPKEQLADSLKEIGEVNLELNGQIAKPQSNDELRIMNDESRQEEKLQAPSYKLQELYSTREAYGDALVLLGQTDPNLVVLDAETSNSTYSEKKCSES